MYFSKKERVRIGNNIKAIRLGFGCDSTKEFVSRLGKDMKIAPFSDHTLDQIESGNYKNLNDKWIQMISEYSMIFPYYSIVEKDLTQIIKYNSLNYQNVKDLINAMDLKERIMLELRLLFPFIEPDIKIDAKHQPSFHVCECLNADFYAYFEKEECIDEIMSALEDFYNMAINEDSPEGAFNYLSLIGYFYYILTESDFAPTGENIFQNNNRSDVLLDNSVFISLKKEIEKKETPKTKKLFFDNYKVNIDECLSILAQSNKYYDYAHFYQVSRCFLGMREDNSLHMTNVDLQKCGNMLLNDLESMGNKYAKKIKNILF